MQYFRTFGADALGALPADFTQRWNTATPWAVALDHTGAARALRNMDGLGLYNGITYTPVDSDADRDDVEIFFTWAYSQSGLTTEPGWFALLRGVGGVNSPDNCYYFGQRTTTAARLRKRVNGVATSLVSTISFTAANDTFYHSVFRVQGSLLYIKMWAGAVEDEPATWNMVNGFSDVSLSAAGFVGFVNVLNNSAFTVTQFGIGTNGDAAPRTAASSTPVDRDADIRWALRSAVNRTPDIRWAAASSALRTAEVQWATRNGLAVDAEVQWGIASSPSVTLEAVWTTLVSESRDINLAWAELLAVQASLSTQWADLQTAESYTDVRWEILSSLLTVTNDLLAEWEIIGRVTADVDIRWPLVSTVSAELSSLWVSLAGVYADANLQWEVASTALYVVKELAVQWATLAAVVTSLDAQWWTLSRALADTSVRWRVAQQAAAQLSTLWGASGLVNTDLSITWELVAQSSAELTLTWRIGDAEPVPVTIHLVRPTKRIHAVSPDPLYRPIH